MHRLNTRKKRLSAIFGVTVVLAAAAVAIAYFTDSGSGTGQAQVGTSSPWQVTFGTTTGTMYPGAGSSTVPYTVTNTGSGNQRLNSTTASVVSSGGNITQGGAPVSGCLASWFNAANSPPAAATIAPGGTATGSVSVTMVESGTNQDACKNATPDILVTAS